MGHKYKAKPKINIDWKEVDEMLEIQCSGLMIAATLGIDETTLYARCAHEKGVGWAQYAANGKGKGKKKLLQRQFTRALKGTAADKILIHLGEKYIDEQMRQADVIQSAPIHLYINDLPQKA